MNECPHTPGMPPTSCMDCIEEGNLPKAPPERIEYGEPFDAKFDGSCRSCGFPISPGQKIRSRMSNRDGASSFVHALCA